MICFRRVWLLRKFYYLVTIVRMKNDVSMCNISMELKICHLHDDIKTPILHNLINHNTNINDPWLSTLDQNSFQTSCKLSEGKTCNNYLYQIIIFKYNYTCKYISVKFLGTMFEFSNFHK